MPITSMTGFGRSDGAVGGHAWTWEIRSVNGHGLGVRLKLPPGTEALETRLREAAGRRCNRGSINATLTMRQTGSAQGLRLNDAVLNDVLRVAESLRARVGGPPPTTAELLSYRGLVETVDVVGDDAAAAVRHAALLGSFDNALEGVVAARAAEGQRLAVVIAAQLAAIRALIADIAASPARRPETIAARLKVQVDRLLEASGHVLDPARLHQEAALLATRMDVEEEVQRLHAHLAAAADLLAAAEPVGRRFDFLTQEFNREANTLCAKSNDPEITRSGLELKAIIDQMREQVQNIE